MTKSAIAAFVGLLGLSEAAPAQMLASDLEDILDYEFLAGWRGSDGTHIAALRLELAPGWKTYWRAPGDAAVPTQVTWDASRNLAAATVIWPHPQVFREFGLRAIGYMGDVVLPFHLKPSTPGAIELNAQVDMAVCENICIPVRMEIKTSLDPAPSAPDPRILEALERQAQPARSADFGQIDCTLSRHDNGYRLDVSATAPNMSGRAPAIVIESKQDGFWASEPLTQLEVGQMQARIDHVDFGPSEVTPQTLSQVHFTLITTEVFVDLGPCGD